RDPSWLALPSVISTDNKFVGLHKVFSDSNFVALSAAGNYTVDWGDGTTPVNYNSGVTAYYQYDYNASGLSGTDAPVTFTASTSTVNRTAHGYTNDMTISFASIVTTTGITAEQVYYVVNASADSFQVSATSGGSALTLTNDGSGTILSYKQAIVQVYPQAGQTFTSINLQLKHNRAGLNAYTSGFCDVVFAGSSLSTLLLGATSVGGTSQNIRFSELEQASVLSCNAQLGSLFNNCYKLSNVVTINSSVASNHNMSYMFVNCYSLQSVPLFNTAAVTNMSSIFNGCSSLQSIPAFNCGTVTSSANSVNMFATCSSNARIQATGFKYTFSVASNKLGVTQLEELFENLALTTGQTLTITNNYGAVSYSLSGTTTSGSTTVTMASTANLATGMEITGTGISSAVAVTMQDTGDTVTRTAHGLANNTRVSFATIVTTTGIAVYTPYYVVNAAADTFQVSDTLGGAAKALTTDGSGTIVYGVTITAITPNTNITLSVPASASATITTNSSVVKPSIATLRGWAIAN
ncbi:MAG: BspA family leucine-rich repeat surface protein, partial [Saprospiraceae bacterium]